MTPTCGFDELDVIVGVSLDGAAEAHDPAPPVRQRIGQLQQCPRSCTHLSQDRHLFSGLLCTIDLQNDPVATYDAFVAFGLPKADFLLPHGIWHSAHRESPSG
jgi:uncharacterized protein